MKISFKPTVEQEEKLKSLDRYVNLSKLMRESLDIVLSKIELTVKKGV